jgi:hypothetical protein
VWTTVIVIPIAIGVPAVIVFIPPPVVRAPARLASLVQLVTRALRLPAIPAVMFHGLVKFVIGFGQAMLAFAFVRAGSRHAGEQQKSSQRRAAQEQFPKPMLSQSMFRFHRILLSFR